MWVGCMKQVSIKEVREHFERAYARLAIHVVYSDVALFVCDGEELAPADSLLRTTQMVKAKSGRGGATAHSRDRAD